MAGNGNLVANFPDVVIGISGERRGVPLAAKLQRADREAHCGQTGVRSMPIAEDAHAIIYGPGKLLIGADCVIRTRVIIIRSDDEQADAEA